jgi:TonB family protein
VVVVVGVAALLGARGATAQAGATSADSNPVLHDVVVTTNIVKLTVSRLPTKPVRLAVRTDSRGKDSLAMLPGDPQDPLCSTRHVEKQARIRGESPHPAYPADLQRAGVSGQAVLEFTIDTAGRVDPASIRLVSSTDPRFAAASRQALSQIEFQPARVDGRRVQSIVQMPFMFNIPRLPGVPSPTK